MGSSLARCAKRVSVCVCVCVTLILFLPCRTWRESVGERNRFSCAHFTAYTRLPDKRRTMQSSIAKIFWLKHILTFCRPPARVTHLQRWTEGPGSQEIVSWERKGNTIIHTSVYRFISFNTLLSTVFNDKIKFWHPVSCQSDYKTCVSQRDSQPCYNKCAKTFAPATVCVSERFSKPSGFTDRVFDAEKWMISPRFLTAHQHEVGDEKQAAVEKSTRY